MNVLISINTKEQFKNISEYTHLFDGAEVYVTNYDEEYLTLIRDSNFKIIQAHMIDLTQIWFDKQLLEQICDLFSCIVYHPVSIFNKNTDKQITIEFMKTLYKVSPNVTLENLNNLNGKARLDLNDVCSIVNNIDGLGLCWDIGHENCINKNSYSIPEYMYTRLKNVHLHDLNDGDHYPFYYRNVDYKKSMEYLKSINYSGSVVAEFAFDYLKGDSIEEKIYEYLNQIALLKEYI